MAERRLRIGRAEVTEDAKRVAGSRRRSKDKAAERSLRDRVRVQLGMQEWRAATDPKVRAQELGIDPSYDLKDGIISGMQPRGIRSFKLFFRSPIRSTC